MYNLGSLGDTLTNLACDYANAEKRLYTEATSGAGDFTVFVPIDSYYAIDTDNRSITFQSDSDGAILSSNCDLSLASTKECTLKF